MWNKVNYWNCVKDMENKSKTDSLQKIGICFKIGTDKEY